MFMNSNLHIATNMYIVKSLRTLIIEVHYLDYRRAFEGLCATEASMEMNSFVLSCNCC